MTVGNAWWQWANWQASSFGAFATAWPWRWAVNSGDVNGTAKWWACCGSLNTYSSNQHGVSGTLITMMVSEINTFLGYWVATALRLGAGWGRGTRWGWRGNGGAHGGGRGARTGSNPALVWTPYTGSGGGWGSANAAAAGKAWGKWAIYIKY